MLTMGELVADFLKTRGVTHIFGLPGGENVPLLEAFRQAGLLFILTHHEASAGFAADVTGQLTGTPGVCLSTLGPGAVNLLAGAASATLERSPMLAITAEVDSDLKNRVTHMQVDLHAIFGPVTKGSYTLHPQSAYTTLEEAWRLATTPPFGAVHLAISPKVTSAGVLDRQRTRSMRPRQTGQSVNLKQAHTQIAQATNVMIIAGVGVEMGAAHQPLQSVAEAWGVPVAVTPKAKGHFPDSHPLYAGCFTAYGDRPLRESLQEADLIVGVGLDGVDFIPSVWDISTPLVNFSPGGAADPVTRPVIAIDGDLPTLLEELVPLRQADSVGSMRAAWIRREITAALNTRFSPQTGGTRIAPLIHALRKALPPEGIVTLDVGVFKLVFLQAWPTDQPKTLFVANGLSAMGYAIPGALAVHLAQPGASCVAIVGDGALHMYAGELATLARLGAPLVVLVVVDHALALIRIKQLRNSVPIFGTEFGATDYQALADAFQLGYLLIEGEEKADAILKTAIDSKRATLVEARIHLAEYDHFK